MDTEQNIYETRTTIFVQKKFDHVRNSSGRFGVDSSLQLA